MYEVRLTIKAKKCKWGQAEVVYLGHGTAQSIIDFTWAANDAATRIKECTVHDKEPLSGHNYIWY